MDNSDRGCGASIINLKFLIFIMLKQECNEKKNKIVLVFYFSDKCCDSILKFIFSCFLFYYYYIPEANT